MSKAKRYYGLKWDQMWLVYLEADTGANDWRASWSANKDPIAWSRDYARLMHCALQDRYPGARVTEIE